MSRSGVQLTVGIISVVERVATVLPGLLDDLASQSEGLPVEILAIVDNRSRPIGAKRNDLVRLARGKYIVQVDDDDHVSDDFVSQLVRASEADTDCIVYEVSVTVDGGPPKRCFYGIEYPYVNTTKAYFRKPGPRMAIRTALARQVRFQEINFGEDADWAARLSPLLKSQERIDRVLYHYDYCRSSSLARNRYQPERTDEAPEAPE
jgi:glycosyltransferase involved in cell wall biosynthesis